MAEERNEWSGRSSSPNESAWTLRGTKYPTAENSLQSVLSIRHRHSPQQLGGKSCKTFLSSKGFTDQEPVTCPTFLVPPTHVGSQWSAKVSPFGGTVRHAVGGPCEYRADAGASTEFSGCLRPDRKRTLGSFEEMRAGLPQLKKGKLTYEKVPGRSDGQTRLTFF
ncbi:hypothetical protein AGOR_G00047260 [Albula goreensis]|uniref:Uncharacterized protein n=1 Tax=Albula goreensis TaxID=1534307 RepID=A0A8T3DT37_9TELE|nr:hypothetical protein AGOR_G00047260 [Albula goreensis]